jgi:uncharacterized protein (TIGR00730 family)
MKLCVFCGSSTGVSPVYRAAAKELGELLAQHKITLVYGGGNVGLMGVLADAVMNNGGEVIGIIPDFLLKREVGHRGITHLEVVQSMHERKKRMADLADGFIAAPGGWGTLEEVAEVLTWRQLGLISNPIGILNVNGFFDPLVSQLELMVKEGFLKASNFQLLEIAEHPADLVSRMTK